MDKTFDKSLDGVEFFKNSFIIKKNPELKRGHISISTVYVKP